MSTEERIIRRLDHVIVVAEDIKPLSEVMSNDLELPLIGEWSQNSDEYDSGSVGLPLGNLGLEILRYGTWGESFEKENPEAASLFRSLRKARPPLGISAIAFEPESILDVPAELDRRRIPRGPVVEWWGGATLRLPGFVDRKADVFLSELDHFENELWAVWLGPDHPRSTEDMRRQYAAAFEKVKGGSLGLKTVTEVVVGALDFAAEERRWQTLFDPVTPIEVGLWQFEAGPALRLVEHHSDKVLRLKVKVRSIEQARAFLEKRKMIRSITPDEITVEPRLLLGLDFVLVA